MPWGGKCGLSPWSWLEKREKPKKMEKGEGGTLENPLILNR